MRRPTLVALALAPALAVGLACGGEPTASDASSASKAGAGSAEEQGPAALLRSYITVQETLADDSVDKLAQLGAKIVTSAEPIQDTPGISEVLIGAGRIASPDIETARVGFEKMSMGLIAYLKAHPDERKDLRLIHCTMAFNNKGAYWVQTAGEVNNPYHGKMMLRCGDPVEWADAPS